MLFSSLSQLDCWSDESTSGNIRSFHIEEDQKSNDALSCEIGPSGPGPDMFLDSVKGSRLARTSWCRCLFLV